MRATKKEFEKIVKRVGFAMGKKTAANPATQGIYIQHDGDERTYAATDGHRIAMCGSPIYTRGVIVHACVIAYAMSLDTDYTLDITNEKIELQCQDSSYSATFHPLDADYPPYPQVLDSFPKRHNDAEICVGSSLEKWLKKIKKEYTSVRVVIDTETDRVLFVAAEWSGDVADCPEQVPRYVVSDIVCKPSTVSQSDVVLSADFVGAPAVNIRYLLDVITAQGKGPHSLTLETHGALDMVVLGNTADATTYVIMPRRV